MELTKISIKLKQKEEEPNLLASAEITLNDVFVVHGIKIVKDKEKLIVKMPYRGTANISDKIHAKNLSY